MPKVSNLPVKLRPYIFHGVDIDYQDGKDNVYGVCPFCGREKFSILVETGEWRCLQCNAGKDDVRKVNRGGNVYTFLTLLHSLGDSSTTEADYRDLANSRCLLSHQALKRWKVCRSPLMKDDWLLLGYSHEGKVNNLYRYTFSPASKKYLLLSTPGLNHSLFGMHLWDKKKDHTYVCEGPWDAMALEEALAVSAYGQLRNGEGILELTGNQSACLLASSNVLAVPGCGTFLDPWLRVFTDKEVVLLYDNDHPRKHPHTGQLIPPAALEGMKRVTSTLSVCDEPPKHISRLEWGSEGYSPELKHGYDVRDFLTDDGNRESRARVELLGQLLTLVAPVPDAWIPGKGKTGRGGTSSRQEGSNGEDGDGGITQQCKHCTSWETMIGAWKEALHWTDGLDRTLSFMLSVIISTKAVGDQLWGKVIGPPSCGKSTLCEALSINRKYTLPKSTIRGFHTGMRGSDGEDMSLIEKARDKTLITKDGDTLLQQPNLGQILSEARDIYDRTSRTHYRNGVGRDYAGINMTWLLCGTPSLRKLDTSELGERFLDCVVMDSIEDELEEAILWRVARRAHKAMSYEANGKMETQYDPELLEAMQLTGGYVGYLRQNAQTLLDKVTIPNNFMGQCIRLGLFTSYFRARPSSSQDEGHEKEFGARLVSQMVRLAQCTCCVLGKTVVDAEVMRRVAQVARDTGRGKTIKIAKLIYDADGSTTDMRTLGIIMGYKDEVMRNILNFMKDVGIIESYTRHFAANYKGKQMWRLTDKVARLYQEVALTGRIVLE